MMPADEGSRAPSAGDPPSADEGSAGGVPERIGRVSQQLRSHAEHAVNNEPHLVATSAGVCCAVLFILSLFSVGSVPPLMYGIRYNRWQKTADLDNVFSGGRYFIFPWNSFLLFPASVQTVEFTDTQQLAQSGIRYPKLHTRTNDGLGLFLQVSLQYRLVRSQVGQLYAEFNKNYEQMFISTIRDTLIRAAADYEAVQFWEDRASVGARMQSMVHHRLKATYAECWGLQLMVIDLPMGFEDSIVLTQVWEQRVATRRFEQTAAWIRANTSVIEADYDRQVKILMAGGKANYTYITKAAGATARQRKLWTESGILGGVRSELGLTGTNLVHYQRYAGVRAMGNATVYFGYRKENFSASPRPSPSPPRPALPPPPVRPPPTSPPLMATPALMAAVDVSVTTSTTAAPATASTSSSHSQDLNLNASHAEASHDDDSDDFNDIGSEHGSALNASAAGGRRRSAAGDGRRRHHGDGASEARSDSPTNATAPNATGSAGHDRRHDEEHQAQDDRDNAREL